MAINPVGSAYFPTKVTKIGKVGLATGATKTSGSSSPEDCQTCQERKYRCGDGSPEKVDSNASTAQVMAHERRHLVEQKAEAEREGKKIVSTNIQIEYDRCPECGRMYASGGEAKSTMVNKADQTTEGIGSLIDFEV